MEFVVDRAIDELGRIVVPKELRQAKGWKKGDRVAFYICDGVVVLETCDPALAQDAWARLAKKTSEPIKKGLSD